MPKGVVAASRRSARQFMLASAGYTVDSKAADKPFSSTMSAPASSVNPNCLESQATRQQRAKAVKSQITMQEVLESAVGSAISKAALHNIVQQPGSVSVWLLPCLFQLCLMCAAFVLLLSHFVASQPCTLTTKDCYKYTFNTLTGTAKRH